MIFFEEVFSFRKKDVADEKCLILSTRCKLGLVMLDSNGKSYETDF